MRRFLILAAALGLAASPAVKAFAADDVSVNVTIGPALKYKAVAYGPVELKYLSDDLRDEVRSAIEHSRSKRPVRVDLMIEDAIPNRPTAEQLSRNVDLSLRSFGLGGASVAGALTYADGSKRVFRDQFYETDLRDDLGGTTWYDAGRAFQRVADDIRRGKLPSEYTGAGPSSDGLFGDRYSH